MYRVLRQRGGHGHLYVRTHVPLPQLRPAAPKAGTGLLPHLPAAHQGRHQDLQAIALQLAGPRRGHLSEAPVRWATPWLPGSPRSEAISHLPPAVMSKAGQVWRGGPGGGGRAQASIASGSNTCCPQKPVPRFSSGTAWQITCLLGDLQLGKGALCLCNASLGLG